MAGVHRLKLHQYVNADQTPGNVSYSSIYTLTDNVVLQKLVTEAITTAADTVNPDALTEQLRLYRSAAQIGLTHTAARSDAVMRKHHALARRLLDRQDDYLRFITNWRIPPTTMAPSGTSA